MLKIEIWEIFSIWSGSSIEHLVFYQQNNDNFYREILISYKAFVKAWHFVISINKMFLPEQTSIKPKEKNFQIMLYYVIYYTQGRIKVTTYVYNLNSLQLLF